MEEEQTDWDLYIDSILFSYRISRQDSTKQSPFVLVFGRQARLPIEFNLGADLGENDSHYSDFNNGSTLSSEQTAAPTNASLSDSAHNSSDQTAAPTNASLACNSSDQTAAPTNASLACNSSDQTAAPTNASLACNSGDQTIAPTNASLAHNSSDQTAAPTNASLACSSSDQTAVPTNASLSDSAHNSSSSAHDLQVLCTPSSAPLSSSNFNLNTPSSTASAPGNDSDFSSDDLLDFDTFLERLVRIRKKALKNIKSAQSRQKKYYDAKHCKDIVRYTVGSLVLLMNSKKHSKKGMKLAPNWTGPYVIHEVLPKGTYRLRDQGNPSKVLSQKVNTSRLKQFFQRSPQLPSTSATACDSSSRVPSTLTTGLCLPSTSSANSSFTAVNTLTSNFMTLSDQKEVSDF